MAHIDRKDLILATGAFISRPGFVQLANGQEISEADFNGSAGAIVVLKASTPSKAAQAVEVIAAARRKIIYQG